nr:EOG090X0BPM [Lepidurus arcticus]
MDDLVCPRCKTTKYRNPSLVLMVNVCGHVLCESCVELLFAKGSGSCIECGLPLRRTNFRVQLFEDPFIDKEVDIRKRVLKDFNKRQEDFATLSEYNDYLEEVETIIFNLVNNIDIVGTNKRIEQYKKDNKDVIQRNRSKQSQDDIELEELLELEKLEGKERLKYYVNQENEERKKKLKAKEALIDELMFSDVDAKSILATHAQALSKDQPLAKTEPKPLSTQFSTGIRIGVKGFQNFLPVPKQEEVPLYRYTPPVLEFMGPEPPTEDRLAPNYTTNVRAATLAEKAGGYCETISCLRALQEAMSGLYYVPASRKEDHVPMDCPLIMTVGNYTHDGARFTVSLIGRNSGSLFRRVDKKTP